MFKNRNRQAKGENSEVNRPVKVTRKAGIAQEKSRRNIAPGDHSGNRDSGKGTEQNYGFKWEGKFSGGINPVVVWGVEKKKK